MPQEAAARLAFFFQAVAKPAVKKKPAGKPPARAKPGKPPVKRAAKPIDHRKNLDPNSKRLTQKQTDSWNSMSAKEQKEYLTEHPKSIYTRLGVKEADDAPENDDADNKTSGKNDDVDLDEAGNPLGAHTRHMTDDEKSRATRRITILKRPGALDKNSQALNESAAVVGKDGAKVLGDNLNADQKQTITAELNAAKSGGDNAPPKRETFEEREARERSERLSADKERAAADRQAAREMEQLRWEREDKLRAEEKAEREAEKANPKKKKSGLGWAMGGLAIAGLLGIGVFAVSPGLALMMGGHIMEHLPNLINATRSRSEASLIKPPSDMLVIADSEDAMQEIADLVAQYLRNGEFPPDLMAKLEAQAK